jgi:putative transposase
MRPLGYCLMPNHFHLVLWPYGDGDLGRWMPWLLTAHVQRYRKVHRSSGHIWQGRFKAFAIEEDEHLLTVLRYVERNALRAGLVPRAADWPWCSLKHWGERPLLPFLDPGPVPRAPDWPIYVDRVEHESELARIRSCVQRQAPFGSEKWASETALKLG